MALSKDSKKEVIDQSKTHEKDTGSSEVQVAIFSEQITKLTEHLKTHKQDNHSRRGLLQMVSKRRKLLDYILKSDKSRYDQIIKRLGLRK